MKSPGIIVLATGALLAAIVGARWMQAGRSAGTAAPPAAPTPPAIVTSAGFTFDPTDRLEGLPGVTTVRLGDRVRVFAVIEKWTPATLAILDKDGRMLWSARLDLPPEGSITGTLPPVEGWEKLAITHGTGEFDPAGFERRIGVPEAELTTGRMQEIGAVRAKQRSLEQPGFTVTEKDWDAATSRCETSIENRGTRVCVIGTAYTYFGTGDAWQGEGPAPDSHWLTAGVRQALSEAATPPAVENTTPTQPRPALDPSPAR